MRGSSATAPSSEGSIDDPNGRGRGRGSSRLPSSFDLLLWAFIVGGIVLRLWHLDAMEFKADEFRNIVDARIAALSPWSAPLLIGEGTTLSPGTFFYQFLAIPVSLFGDPVSVARFIAFLNIAGIGALYLSIGSLFGARIALWTTALFATAPWTVVFSRKIWNPDLLVPFLTITLLLLASCLHRFARWKVYAIAVFLALLAQLHLSVWLALVPTVVLSLLMRPWRRPRELIASVLIFLAVYALTLGPRIDEFVSVFPGHSTQQIEANVVRLVGHNMLESIRISSGGGFQFLLGDNGFAAFENGAVVRWSRAGFLLYGGLVAAGLGYALRRSLNALRSRSRRASELFLSVLLAIAFSIQVFYFLFRIYSPPHYHVILSFLPPLLVALLLAWIVDRLGSAAAVLGRALLVIVLAANVCFGFAFLAFVHDHPYAIDGDYGHPYFVERQRWESRLQSAIASMAVRHLRASNSPDGPNVDWRSGHSATRPDAEAAYECRISATRLKARIR